MDIKLCANLGYVQPDFAARCPVTGQIVTSYRQRANIMAEHNLVDANDLNPAKRIAEEERAFRERAELAKQVNPLSPKVTEPYRPTLP